MTDTDMGDEKTIGVVLTLSRVCYCIHRIASLLKFAGYIHSHKILPGNIFGLILKNKMAATGVFRL